MKPIIPIPEPVENWQSVAGYNLLDKYYQDPARWGYTFQVNCILSRMTQLSQSFQTMTPDKVYVSERSVQADKFIFARLMHKLNKMTDMEYQLYLQMFESLENLFNKHAFVKNTNIERFPLMGQPQNYFFQN
jgi:deoxyguanosine kinase